MKKHQVVLRRSAPSRSSSSSSSGFSSSSLSSSKSVSSRYGQCQKNHVASTGGYAVDGCREFMARGEEAGMSLTCAACGCHRNFHKREVDTQVVLSDQSSPPS